MKTIIFSATSTVTTAIIFYCFAIILYRLDECLKESHLRARIKYILIGLLLLVAGAYPWLRFDYPGLGNLLLSVIVLILLTTGCLPWSVLKKWRTLRRNKKIDEAWSIDTDVCDVQTIDNMHERLTGKRHRRIFSMLANAYYGIKMFILMALGRPPK